MNSFLIPALFLASTYCCALAAQPYEIHSPSFEPSGGIIRSGLLSMEGNWATLGTTNSGGRFEIRGSRLTTLAAFPSQISINALPDGRLLLSWLETSGLEIDLEWNENLLGSNWSMVVPRPMGNSLVVIPSDLQRFYRLRLR